MGIRRSLTILGFSGILAIAHTVVENSTVQKVQAQPPNLFVVFVNGSGDCCAEEMYELKNRLRNKYNAEIWNTSYADFKDGSTTRKISVSNIGSLSIDSDTLFLSNGKKVLNQIPDDQPIVLIGHSFGGDSVLKLLPLINRKIQVVAVLDPVASGGVRKPDTWKVPENVDLFVNRYQKKAPFPFNFFKSGKIKNCKARIRCFQNSHGTSHFNMPSSSWIQDYVGDKIDLALDKFTPPRTEFDYSQSRIFDCSFYLETYGDLRDAFGNNCGAAKDHWINTGINEGRRSSPAFDVGYYLGNYPDLQRAFGSNNFKSAAEHWINNGISEGRRSALYFEAAYYLGNYPDLQRAFGSRNYSAAVDHWLNNGLSEGRQGSPDFAPQFYLSTYSDVANVYGANNKRGAISHYMEFGRNERRKGTP